ncbi:MAG: FtsQ-type POTRA domain-containing protein, partial [Clostridia bacterium]|nr:FtsQ-type POTRA domain-containing protein [Clostridia bacterium]
MRNKKSDYRRVKRGKVGNSRRIKKRRNNRKRKLFLKRVFMIVFLLSLVGLIVYGVMFALNSVFCVKEIYVEGNTMYSDKEIVDVSGFNTGDGMLFLNTDNAEKRLYKSFNYIDNVKIHKELPDKLKISI